MRVGLARIAAAAALSLALQGCSQGDEARDAAVASVRASLAEAGLQKPAFRSSAWDGMGRLELAGLTAGFADGGTLSAASVVIHGANPYPMLPRWSDVGPVEIMGWTAIAAPPPLPRGFSADRAEFIGVEGRDGDGASFTADRLVLDGWDTRDSRLPELRGWLAEGLEAFTEGERVLSVHEASWAVYGRDAEGRVESFRISADAVSYGAAPGVPGPVPFAVRASYGPGEAAGETAVNGTVDAGGHGRLAFEARLEGLKAPAALPSADAEGLAGTLEGVRLLSFRLEADGLSWVGDLIDAEFPGGREAAVTAMIPAAYFVFGASGGSRADEALGAMALFLRQPEGFELRLEPPGGFPPEGVAPFVRAPTLDELGLSLRALPPARAQAD